MKLKAGDVIVYKGSEALARYGTGVLTSIDTDEYSVLWSGRGLTKYKRAILDDKLDQIFERIETSAGLPKERQLQLGSSKKGAAVAFNENYDREKVALLCEKLKTSTANNAQNVADGLSAQFFTKKKLSLRGTARTVLLQLAELCNGGKSGACEEARDISKELFFGYVLQKSDFHTPEAP